MKRFIERIRVYDIGDQDQIADWIWKQFPGIFYVTSGKADGSEKRESAQSGMYLGGDESLTSRDRLNANVRQGHGPLGALLSAEDLDGVEPLLRPEGRRHALLVLFPAKRFERPRPSRLGRLGRAVRAGKKRHWRDTDDSVEGKTSGRATVWRWRDAFQRAFQARMDWCVKPRNEANHRPVAVLNGDATRAILMLNARAGRPRSS